jgi:hypothetical protein
MGPKSRQKEETTNKSGLQGEHEQIKYYTPPNQSQGGYQIRRGEEHLKKHLV